MAGTLSLGRFPSIPSMLDALIEGTPLSSEEAEAMMNAVFDGETDPALVAGLLVALRGKGETDDELTGMVRSMLGHAQRVELSVPAIDVVGTGGDAKHSVNISTMAALTIAGAGMAVAKHGNRSASSSVGAADVLEALGLAIELTPAQVASSIEASGFGFMFAPSFHPAMRFVGPVRKALGVRTTFNFLGPLANPAQPPYFLLGVGSAEIQGKVAHVLGSNGVLRAWVVRSEDGFDELTTSAPSRVIEITGDGSGAYEQRSFTLDPGSLGFVPSGEAALTGGDVAHNAEVVRSVLAGASGPIRDAVVLNAAAGLVISGHAEDLVAGIGQAERSLDEGRAATVLASAIEASHVS